MMKPVLFACDIDNTLIYSRKWPHAGFSCVEWIHGEEQAYMSPETAEGLRALMTECHLIPVTSRSVAQYRRLCFPEGCVPTWAVTANGADLLRNGEPDAAWREETNRLIAPELPELTRMYQLLADDARFIRCRLVDDAYLFVYCGREVPPAEVASALAAQTTLQVIPAGKKVYLMPARLNKACAVQRLRQRFSPQYLLSAGDSGMDIPMLAQADRAILPEALALQCAPEGRYLSSPENELFSEFVVKAARAFVAEC